MITRLIAAAVAVLALLSTGAGWAHADVPTGSASPVAAPAGTYPVGRVDTEIDVQGRRLMVSVWYPALAAGAPAPYVPVSDPAARLHVALRSADWMHTALAGPVMAAATAAATEGAPIDTSNGPLPVLVLSPGLGTPRWNLSGLATAAASLGWVVVTVDHTGEAPSVQLGDGTVVDGDLPYLTDDLMGARLAQRITDVRLVLDRLSTLPVVGGHLDLERVAMGGHSYGGTTAIQTAAADPRVRAVVLIDSPAGWQGVVGAPTLTVPVLDLRLTVPWADGWPQAIGADRVTLAHAAHYSATDLCSFGADAIECGTVDVDTATHVTRTVITRWLDRQLRDGAAPRFEAPQLTWSLDQH